MGVRKEFDKELFEKNDAKARRLAKEFYAKKGIVLEDNPKKLGVDLMVMKDGECVGYVECEIKHRWPTKEFPYQSVQFPERKAKYCYETQLPVEFFMLNDACDRCLIVDGKDVVTSPLKEVRNRYVYQGELFFQVPVEKVKFYDVGD